MTVKKNKKINRKQSIATMITNRDLTYRPNRGVKDAGTWKRALNSADGGIMRPLFDLYDYTLIDGILSDAIQKRIDAVVNSPLQFLDKDGQTIDEIKSLIDTTEFEKVITTIMQSRFWGRSGFELDLSNEFKIRPIPARHIDVANKQILINPYDTIGVHYEDDPFILVIGENKDEYGLLMKTAPYTIYKRGGFGDWAQWIELFGMPQRIGKYNTYNPESKDILVRAMQEAGSASWIVVPNDADIETKDSAKGSGATYNNFRKGCNEEILITILGQTLTTTQEGNGSYALGEVHKQVEEGKNKSDIRMVQRILNQYFCPMLEARGYDLKGGSFIFPKAARQLTVAEVCQLSKVINIPASWVHETFSIPEPKSDDVLVQNKSLNANVNEERQSSRETTKSKDKTVSNSNSSPKDIKENEKNKTQNISNSDQSLFKRLLSFFAVAPVNGAQTKTPQRVGTSLVELSDNSQDMQLIRNLYANRNTTFDLELFQHTSKKLLSALKKGKKIRHADKDISVNYMIEDSAFESALEKNLWRFSMAKSLAEVQALNEILDNCDNFDEFKEQAITLCNQFNIAAQAEYQTAISAAEGARTWKRQHRESNLFPYLIYRTVGDSDVRSSHAMLEGVVFKANDPELDEIYPPNGWRCRCWMEQAMKNEIPKETPLGNEDVRLKTFTETTDWKNAKKDGWGSNRGKEALIFKENQFYLELKTNKSYANITPDDWGLLPLRDAMKKSNKKCVIEENIDRKKYRDEHTKSNNQLVFKDVDGLTLVMSKKDFDLHAGLIESKKTEVYKQRAKYLGNIEEVLKTPDEVWLDMKSKGKRTKSEDKKYDNKLYLKYYADEVLVCACNMTKERLIFKSWYPIEDVEKFNRRQGLLIRKKKR